ncbi:MAG: hypothetical protein AAGI38_08785 [Bacteroidota bacterium]
MKNLLKLAFFFTFMIVLVGCGSNDDDDDTPTPSPTPTEDCSASDWTGNYSGTVSCDGGAAEAATAEVTEQSVSIQVVASTGGTVDYTISTDQFGSCMVNFEAGPTTYTFTLDNDNLVLIRKGSFDTCTYTLTRD